MKLRNQGIVLIVIPAICQIVFVGVLAWFIVRLNSAGAEETRIKQIMTKCQELPYKISSSYMHILMMNMSGARNVDATFEETNQSVRGHIKNLQTLVPPSDPMRKTLDSYIGTIEHLMNLVEESKNAIKRTSEGEMVTPTFADFIGEREYTEELTAYLRQASQQAAKINAHYTPVVQEFQPESQQSRMAVIAAIVALIFFNIVVAIGLAVFFSRQTISRLDTLMSNIQNFSEGKLDLSPVGGGSELAELDESFRKMAYAKHASDEMRRSIVAMVSHDMRSPLTSVQMVLTMVLEKVYGPVEPGLEKVLTRVNSEIYRLVRLASDLLDSEKIESGKIDLDVKEHVLKDITDQALNAIQGMSSMLGTSIETEVPENLPIACDADRIIQVLVNFLSNALKYSARGSTVQLRARHIIEGDLIRIEVIDHGPGIAEHEIDTVFEKFKQLAQSGETKRQGAGLGLAICKALVEEHGGNIGVESELGKGSCFFIELPGAAVPAGKSNASS